MFDMLFQRRSEEELAEIEGTKANELWFSFSFQLFFAVCMVNL